MSDQDVLFISDLARELRCSVTTIKARLSHAPHRLPPPMASIDRRPRWHRPTVEAWKAEPARTAATFGQKKRGWR